MSGFSAGFNNTFSTVFNAALSGQKFKIQEEELKRARLERADYEFSAQYRENKRQLDLLNSQAALDTERAQKNYYELSQQKTLFELEEARATAPVARALGQSQVEESGARRKEAEARTAGQNQANTFALENRAVDKKIKAEELATSRTQRKTANSNLAAAQIGQTTAQVGLFAKVGENLTPGAADLMQVVEGLGPNLRPVEKATMFQVLSGVQDNKARELDEHKTFLAQQKQKDELELAQKRAETINYAASRGAAYVGAIGEIFGKDDPIYRGSSEVLARGGLPTDRSNVDPLVLEEGKVLVKQISDLTEKIGLAKQGVVDAKNTNYGVLTSRSKAEGRAAGAVSTLEEQKAAAEARLAEIKGGSSSAGSTAAKPTLAEIAPRVLPTATDAQLEEIAKCTPWT
jgi:hypothetical protein